MNVGDKQVVRDRQLIGDMDAFLVANHAPGASFTARPIYYLRIKPDGSAEWSIGYEVERLT